MHCAIHTDREAIGACVYCGNGICRECLNKIDGKMYCETCALILGHKIEEERLREARLPVRVRYDNKPTLLSTRRPKEPWVAAFLSFLLPGLGQIYNGQLGKGILFFFFSITIIGYVIGVIDAFNSAKKINNAYYDDLEILDG